MKKSGFTLAEVLITLVIIGVIAALTIGTVVSNTTKKQLEAKTKKFYTQFANAFETYKVVIDAKFFINYSPMQNKHYQIGYVTKND